MRGRSQMLMSNSSRCFHTGSEHTLTSELDTVLHSVSLPWKRPACTTSWGRRGAGGRRQRPSLPLPPGCPSHLRLESPLERSSFHVGLNPPPPGA